VSVTLAFAHATGFCGAVWQPVIEALDSQFAILNWDFPNHGSAPGASLPIDWWIFGEWARDQVAAVADPLIGVGHSMGGTALVMAEVLRPKTFAALILIEPMLFPPPYRRSENRLSRGVLKRKPSFPSRDAARENFASKEPFLTWHPAALEGYVRDGLVEVNGQVSLACSPQVESDIYEGATAHAAWERTGEVTTPILVLAGSDSDNLVGYDARAIANRFPRAGVEVIAGANHFLPMEQPELLARRIARMASSLSGKPGP
jgi:pimeloyl-ACP methyl ester carboxylesterase